MALFVTCSLFSQFPDGLSIVRAQHIRSRDGMTIKVHEINDYVPGHIPAETLV